MKKEIKKWIKNYIFREIIHDQDLLSFQKRNYITIGDLIVGILWFPIFIVWRILSFPFRIKIFKN